MVRAPLLNATYTRPRELAANLFKSSLAGKTRPIVRLQLNRSSTLRLSFYHGNNYHIHFYTLLLLSQRHCQLPIPCGSYQDTPLPQPGKRVDDTTDEPRTLEQWLPIATNGQMARLPRRLCPRRIVVMACKRGRWAVRNSLVLLLASEILTLLFV